MGVDMLAEQVFSLPGEGDVNTLPDNQTLELEEAMAKAKEQPAAEQEKFNVAAALRDLWTKMGPDAANKDVEDAFKLKHPTEKVASAQVSSAKKAIFPDASKPRKTTGKRGRPAGGAASGSARLPAPGRASDAIRVGNGLASDLSALADLVKKHGVKETHALVELLGNFTGNG
jgi:hypothetical protein